MTFQSPIRVSSHSYIPDLETQETFGETIISYPLQHEQEQPSGVSTLPPATSPTANSYSVTIGGSYPKPHHRSSNAISIRPHPEVLAKKKEVLHDLAEQKHAVQEAKG